MLWPSNVVNVIAEAIVGDSNNNKSTLSKGSEIKQRHRTAAGVGLILAPQATAAAAQVAQHHPMFVSICSGLGIYGLLSKGLAKGGFPQGHLPGCNSPVTVKGPITVKYTQSNWFTKRQWEVTATQGADLRKIVGQTVVDSLFMNPLSRRALVGVAALEVVKVAVAVGAIYEVRGIAAAVPEVKVPTSLA